MRRGEDALDSQRQWKVAVLGSALAGEDSVAGQKAFEIGHAAASKRMILLTGACPGLPHSAVLGASSAGGLTVGISPALNREEHISIYSYPVVSRIILYTGMGLKGRNVLLVRSSDACIFIGGGMGTLNEFTIAYDELGPTCVLAVLLGTGGLSNEFEKLASLSGHQPSALFITEWNPQTLVEKILKHLESSLAQYHVERRQY